MEGMIPIFHYVEEDVAWMDYNCSHCAKWGDERDGCGSNVRY